MFTVFSAAEFDSSQSQCRVCGVLAEPFGCDSRRHYFRCPQCALIFVPPRQYLSVEAEKAEYDLHDNQINDVGYRRFLARLAEPLLARVPAQARGLDFGCGPGPALAAMLSEHGLTVDLFDVFYQPDQSVFQRQYDFICATEVVEHLHCPSDELERLWRCLKPGGVLALMTKLARDREAFSRWHYKNDQTHVCFFSRKTFLYLAERLSARLEIIGADVIFLYKSAP